jgi:hypothetical protein
VHCEKPYADNEVERDSSKDEAVVFIFIFATVGLLVYAAIRPWVERWAEVRLDLIPRITCTNSTGSLQSWKERRSYIPISNAGADES